jgi:hypothetical protein
MTAQSAEHLAFFHFEAVYVHSASAYSKFLFVFHPGSEVLLTMDAARQTTKYDATVHDPLGLDLLTITVGGSQDTVLIDGTTMTGLSC